MHSETDEPCLPPPRIQSAEVPLALLTAFDLLQNPVWVFDIDQLKMRWANPAAVYLWNASSREELLSRNLSDVSESTQIRLQTYLQQFKQGKTFNEQWTFYPGGHPVSVNCRCSGISLECDRLVMLVEGVIVTNQQVDQDILRSIEALRHTNVMISLYTRDGVPVLRNPAALQCYGDISQSTLEPEDSSETHGFLRCLVDRDLRQQARQALTLGQVFSVETQVYTLEGIRWHGVAARLTNDPVTGQSMLLVNERDITALKDAELQLRQTNEELARATRLKDEFLANMSHELRTPLNAILGMTEGLKEGVFGDVNQEQSRALQTIEQSGSHLLDLINDILDVAKIESGQIELDYGAIAVAPLCQSSLVFIKQQAEKKRIQLEIQLPPNLPSLPDLWGDERRIRQVLINLLNNAVKFTPDGGRITLTVSALPQQADQKPYLQIAIVDTGIGIAPEHIPRLFRPFIQVDSSLNREYQGTGLGLALVKRIVEIHGGQVGLTSQVGVGSCFTIELPCVEQSDTVAKPLPPVESVSPPHINVHCSTNAPVILLAEDNEANINTVSVYLEAKGYCILLAKNGYEAVNLTRSAKPDLILMDIQMPGMDGLEAIQHIRQDPDFADLPIIALTALALEGDQERCLAAGATDYLSKPVKLKHLATLIETLVTPNHQN